MKGSSLKGKCSRDLEILSADTRDGMGKVGILTLERAFFYSCLRAKAHESGLQVSGTGEEEKG